MALIEIDEIAVKRATWKMAKAGDPSAIKELYRSVNGLVLYLHAFHVADDQEIVTLRELREVVNILEVTIKSLR